VKDHDTAYPIAEAITNPIGPTINIAIMNVGIIVIKGTEI
jgi:hypothetical protein